MNALEIQVAAKLYALVRDQHHELKERITATVADSAHRRRMLQEAEPDVRARFRRIATRLMQKSGVDIPHRPEVCYLNRDPATRERRDREHAVPLALIHDRILGLRKGPRDDVVPPPKTSDEIAALLTHHIRVIGVTKLQHASLPASMPAEWQWFGEPMARYHGLLHVDEDGRCGHCRDRGRAG